MFSKEFRKAPYAMVLESQFKKILKFMKDTIKTMTRKDTGAESFKMLPHKVSLKMKKLMVLLLSPIIKELLFNKGFSKTAS